MMRKPDIREKVLQNGITYPTTLELIMVLLGTGIQGVPVAKLAQKVLNTVTASPMENLMENLMKLEGIGPSKAVTIAAAIEFGRRQNIHTGKRVSKPSDLIPFVNHYAMQEQEHFICVTLNGANEIIKIRTVSVGTINKTMVHPREVFTGAIKDMASAVILCHNHPSGNCIPSNDDIETTHRMVEAGECLGIQVLDHIIITTKGFFSLKEEGLLTPNLDTELENLEDDDNNDDTQDFEYLEDMEDTEDDIDLEKSHREDIENQNIPNLKVPDLRKSLLQPLSELSIC